MNIFFRSKRSQKSSPRGCSSTLDNARLLPRHTKTSQGCSSDWTTRCQFHQCFLHSFYACRAQKRKKDCEVVNLFTLLGTRRVMKLTTGVNFINVFCAAFTHMDPKSVKWYWQLEWVLTLLWSVRVKDALWTLMKLTPGVNFIIILWATLAQVDLRWS